jgi:hypothetical protein
MRKCYYRVSYTLNEYTKPLIDLWGFFRLQRGADRENQIKCHADVRDGKPSSALIGSVDGQYATDG